MIKYSNIKRYNDVEFDQYLAMPGKSQSFLKNEVNGRQAQIEVTMNMRLGTMVDDILTAPHKVKMTDELYVPAKEIAFRIKERFGWALGHLKKQVSYTADVSCHGFTLQTKARLDLLLEKLMVLDLKVTMSKDVKRLVEFMGYNNQLWHYAKVSQVPKAFLLIHSVPLKKTELMPVDVSSDYNEFWSHKIMRHGAETIPEQL